MHCSGDTVAHLTFTVARWLRWPRVDQAIYREKSPISRDLSQKIIWPIFLQEKSCRSPSTHDISAIYRRKSATFSSLNATYPERRTTSYMIFVQFNLQAGLNCVCTTSELETLQLDCRIFLRRSTNHHNLYLNTN